MSFVKWCPTQHALPRSAILTEIVSTAMASATSSASLDAPSFEALLLMSMPDTSRLKRSLPIVSVTAETEQHMTLTRSSLFEIALRLPRV